MGTISTKWRPTWWKQDEHESAWDLVKEALHRDWEQTKHDLKLGGHEMNQGVGDTLKQAGGSEKIPAMDKANPPKVIGEWNDAEVPYAYGYGARKQFGAQHPQWNEGLETKLKSEWTAAQDKARRDWDEMKSFVRRGYEYKDKNPRS